MTVKSEGGRITLEGRCRVEDAETLLSALQLAPGSAVHMEAAETVHLAVVQVLLAVKPPLTGLQPHSFLGKFAILEPPQGAAAATRG